MKVGNNGLKINTGLVKAQHKSNMISTMLGGGNSVASLSSLASGDTGTYSPSSAKGTAREQAKEIMKEYEESRRAAEQNENAESAKAEASGTDGTAAEKTEAAAEKAGAAAEGEEESGSGGQSAR